MAVTRLGPGGYPVASAAAAPIVMVTSEAIQILETKLRTSLLMRSINETVRLVENKLASLATEIVRLKNEFVQVSEGRLGLIFAEVTRVINELVYPVEANLPPPSTPSQSLVLTHTVADDRNDFTGEVGVRLGIGPANIDVNWVGYRVHAGNTGLHTVTLYEWFSDSVVFTTTVDLTGKAADSWVWKAIPPVTLLANGYYALMTNVTASDGQFWLNNSAVTMQPSITNIYATYRSGGALGVTGINQTFVGLDLGSSATAGAMPPPVTSGLLVRLDASALALADGASVTSWPNLGSSPNPGIYGTPPIFKKGVTPSGGPAVRESQTAFIHADVPGVTQDFTIFHVVRMWGSHTGRAFSSNGWAFLFGFHGTVQDGMFDTEVWLNAGVPYGAFPGPWKLYSADAKTAGGYASRFFINGVLSGTSNPAYAGANKGLNQYNLGGYDLFGTESSDHETAELLIYDHKLTDAERISVEDYLRNKWLLTSRRPFAVLALVRLLSESVRISEAILKSSALIRARTELVRIEQVVVRYGVITRVVNSIVRVNETLVQTRFIRYVIDESVRIGESVLRSRTMTRVRDEVERVNETLVNTSIVSRVIDELERISEDVLRSRAMTRVRDEIVQVSDGVAVVAMQLARLLDESIRVSEAVLTASGLGRVVNELVRIAESLRPTVALTRVRDEIVRLIEGEPVFLRPLIRVLDEVVHVTHTLFRTLGLFRSVGETLTPKEKTEFATGQVWMANEPVTITEARIPTRRILRLRGEYVRSLETRQPVRALLRVVSDLLHLPELTRGIATIPTLVCSVIKLYAMYAGDAMLAPLVMGSVLVNPEVGGGSTSVNVAIDGEPEMEPLVDGQPEVKPLVEAEVKIEECC